MGCACSSSQPNELKTDMTHFTVLRTIGKGGFGTVTAVQKRTMPLEGEIFAMKALGKVQLLSSRNGLRIAWLERNVMRVIDSPFVPNLHFTFQDEASLYLVMDFLPGGDMAYLIKQRNKLTEQQACFYAAEIALGLEALHKAKVVYRDLKPANIILDKYGHVRITDFGVSCVLEEKHNFQTKGDAGTPGYQSPEMLHGKKYMFEPDFYAYGITLYSMLVGKRPFHDNSLAVEGKTEPRVWTDVSEVARDLITKLLKAEPEKRIHDWATVKAHSFFADINFDKLSTYEMEAPIIPDSNKINFPIECEMEALLMCEDPKRLKDQKKFNGYTYDYYRHLSDEDKQTSIE